MDIFDYNDYKKFLIDFINAQPGGGRGVRAALADAMGCQRAYLTRVLSEGADISSEQALKAATYLALTSEGVRHFLLLVQFARAGSNELRDHFKILIREAREKHLSLQDRFKVAKTLSGESEAIYFSSWEYAAEKLLKVGDWSQAA